MFPSTLAEHEIASIQIPISTVASRRLQQQQQQHHQPLPTVLSSPPPPTSSSSSPPAITTTATKTNHSWTFRGYSRAGVATSFLCVEPKWMLDCGCIIPSHPHTKQHVRPSCIFLTHTHLDHIQSLPQILFSYQPPPSPPFPPATTKSTHATTPPSTILVFFPKPSEVALRKWLQSYHELIRDDDDDDNDDDRNHITSTTTTTNMEQYYRFQLCPVQVHDEFVLPHPTDQLQPSYTYIPQPSTVSSPTATTTTNNRRSSRKTEYIVRIVECQHRKVCYGYSIFQRQAVLAPPYCDMSGPELQTFMRSVVVSSSSSSSSSTSKTLRPPPVSLYEWTLPQPLVCYLGDTTTQVLSVLHPELLQQHTIIVIECTYYYNDVDDQDHTTMTTTHRERRKTPTTTNPYQHTYWEPLRTQIVQQHPHILFVLQHFSSRHRTQEWRRWMNEYNQSSGYYNVHAMLPATTTTSTTATTSSTTTTDSTTTTRQPPKQHSTIPIATDHHVLACNCFLCQPGIVASHAGTTFSGSS
jgi:ribonuclease BN (tRNA processing enzyme)